MATAAVARPGQALRQRRDAPRPSLSKRNTNIDAGEPPIKKRKLTEPLVRTSAYILNKHKGKPPSLIVELHDTFWRLGRQEGSFAYDSPMRVMLEHLKRGTVPHDMLEELLTGNVPFYDGCLIVEVQNHKTAGAKEKGRSEAGAGADSKFSMDAYNEHITPSPFAPFPKQAGADATPEKSNEDMPAPERSGKGKDKGLKVYTVVLHPTPLTQHHEIMLLMNTPASELRCRKKGGDTGTPSSANPSTPQTSVPPTPISTTRGPLSQSQKMALEEGDVYSFQGDLLVATEPPMYLEPVSNPQEAERVLEALAHPLHNEKPPASKTRKRTTAEMAADDAQRAEDERRMLIMDERIKPAARTGAGAAANENQGAAASLGFSRFKTLEMVRQKHDEQDRLKKEEEARAQSEKKIHDEQAALKAQHQMREKNQRDMVMAQQQAMQNRNQAHQRQEQMRMLQEQQRQMAARDHAHPQQNQMMASAQQGNFQHPGQGSPVARQQTPMMNSSPMLPNGGFPMAQTSSQGAGSPQRPTSAAMQNRNVSMARQTSQQAHGSQNNTPHLPQGTPGMAQAIPNRQMSQTPRMQTGSPAAGMQGTPTSMPMQTPHMAQAAQLTPEQIAMLQQQRAALVQSHQNGQFAGAPGAVQGMTPDQIQAIQQQQMQNRMRAQHAQAQQAMMRATAQGQNPQVVQEAFRRHLLQQQQQNQMQAAHMRNLQGMGGQAGSPGGMHHPQPTPQMGHAHPQTPLQQHPNGGQQDPASQQQYAMAQAKAQQMAVQRQQAQQANLQLQNVSQQYGGWQNIPNNVVQTLPPQVQMLLRQQQMKQRQVLQAQAARVQQMAAQHGGDQQVPAGQPNPQYMQALRSQQGMLAQQMQQGMHGSPGGMQGLAMNMNMGNMGQPQQQMGRNDQLDQHFANMANALQRPQQGGQ